MVTSFVGPNPNNQIQTFFSQFLANHTILELRFYNDRALGEVVGFMIVTPSILGDAVREALKQTFNMLGIGCENKNFEGIIIHGENKDKLLEFVSNDNNRSEFQTEFMDMMYGTIHGAPSRPSTVNTDAHPQ